MTAGSRGRLAIAVLIAVLAFAAAFAVRKATAGTAKTAASPTPFVPSSTPVRASGVALPATTLPALHRRPRPSTPAPSQTPTPTPTPSAPSAPRGGGGGGGGSSGGGPVVVG